MKKTALFALIVAPLSMATIAFAQVAPDPSNIVALPPPAMGGAGLPSGGFGSSGNGGPGLPGSGAQNMPPAPFPPMNPPPVGGPSGNFTPRPEDTKWFGGGGGGVQGMQNNGRQFQDNQGNNQEERMKQDQQRRLQDMQRSSKQMEKDINMFEKRFKYLAGKGAPIDQDAKDALQKAKDLIVQIKNAKTIDEAAELSLDDFRDYMQTMNEGMQKAEMGAQFPRMLKEANKIIKQQQAAYKRAETKSSKLKVDVSSLLTDWKKLVDEMISAVSAADQAFKNSKIDDAVETLRDEVFDVANVIGEKQKVFEMVSNFQQMAKNSDREIKTMQKDLAKLKKQGKDAGELETLLSEVRAKIEEAKKIISSSNFDSDVLITMLEDAQTAKGDFYDAYAEITGQFVPGSSQGMQIPGLQYNRLQMPQSFGNFMNMQPQGMLQGVVGGKPGGPVPAGGSAKQTCRIDALGIEVPGKCEDVERLFNPGSTIVPGSTQTTPVSPQVPTVSPIQQSPPINTVPGPQSLKKALEELSLNVRATVIDSLRNMFKH